MQYNTRYYSPSLGRFINRDTIGEAGGLNLYAYVGNRVPNSFDMLGMWEVEQHEDGTFTVKQNFNTDAGDNWQSYTFNSQAEVDAFLFGNSGSVGHEDFEALPGSTPRGMWSADRFLQERGTVNDMLVETRGQSDWLNPDSQLGRRAARDAEARAFERLVDAAGRNNGAAIQSPEVTVAPGARGGTYALNGRFNSETAAALAAAQLMRTEIGAGLRAWEFGAGIYRQISATADGTHYETHYGVTPITPGLEWGGRLTWYVRGHPVSEAENRLFTNILDGRMPGLAMVAYIHSHPVGGGGRFSNGDMDFARLFRLNAYVLTHNRGLLVTRHHEITTWPPTPENLLGTQVPGVARYPGEPND